MDEYEGSIPHKLTLLTTLKDLYMKLLDDKIIFLTGGSKGIGLECAKKYIEAGAQVAIVSNDATSLAESIQLLADRSTGILCDVSTPSYFEDAIPKNRPGTFYANPKAFPLTPAPGGAKWGRKTMPPIRPQKDPSMPSRNPWHWIMRLKRPA